MRLNGKKVTIKLYLNKDIKHRVDVQGLGKYYRVYVQITYNRKTTRFPVDDVWAMEERFLENKFGEVDVIRCLEHIIQFDAQIIKEAEYSVIGLGNRISSYLSDISSVLRYALKLEMSKELGSFLSHKAYLKWLEGSYESMVQEYVDLASINKHREVLTRIGVVGFASILDKIPVFKWFVDDSVIHKFKDGVRKWEKTPEGLYTAFGVLVFWHPLDSKEELEALVHSCTEMLLQVIRTPEEKKSSIWSIGLSTINNDLEKSFL